MQVRPVQSSPDLKAFIDLPYRLHRDDPVWVPPFRQDVRTLLSKKKNPFFDHGDAAYFLAEREGRVTGRIAAITNRLHNETHGDRVCFFGPILLLWRMTSCQMAKVLLPCFGLTGNLYGLAGLRLGFGAAQAGCC